VLAFPATWPDAGPDVDVRGLGAVLYALLANRWPLPESGAGSEFAPARCGAESAPKKLAAIDSAVPLQISNAAADSLRARGPNPSAAALLNALQRACAEPHSRAPQSGDGLFTATARDRSASSRGGRPADLADVLHRNRLAVGFAAVGASVILTAVLLAASALSHIVGDGNSGVSLAHPDRLGLRPSVSAPPSPSPAAAGQRLVVKPVQAKVFSPGGDPDSPQSAGLAIDGDPATAWSTDTYFDPAPFPSFKQGVGLLLQLPQPTALAAVGVDLDSTGTVVQIRSSSTAAPAKLADTTELTPPTPIQPGHNTIPVNTRTPTSTVLVWISTLGRVGGKSRSDISEITLQPAS
jgi:putative peptidoglycan lipid II flippase